MTGPSTQGHCLLLKFEAVITIHHLLALDNWGAVVGQSVSAQQTVHKCTGPHQIRRLGEQSSSTDPRSAPSPRRHQPPPLPRVPGAPNRVQEPGSRGEFPACCRISAPRRFYPGTLAFQPPTQQEVPKAPSQIHRRQHPWQGRDALEVQQGSSVCEGRGHALLTEVALKGV